MSYIDSELKYFFNKIQKYTKQSHYRDNCQIFSMINLYGINTLNMINDIIKSGKNVLSFENIYLSLAKEFDEDMYILCLMKNLR